LLYVLANSDVSRSVLSRYESGASDFKTVVPSQKVVPGDQVCVDSEHSNECNEHPCKPCPAPGNESNLHPPKTLAAQNSCSLQTVRTQASRVQRFVSSWVEDLHYALSLSHTGWKKNAVLAVLDVAATVMFAVLLPFLVPTIVHLMKGGRYAVILVNMAVNMTFFAVYFRCFRICAGLWLPRRVLVVFLALSVFFHSLGLVFVQLFNLFETMANVLPFVYVILSDLCWGHGRPMHVRALHIFGAFTATLPIYLSLLIHSWLVKNASSGSFRSHTFGKFRVNEAIWIAMFAWACMGITVQYAASWIWRHSTRKGARTLKLFQFSVHFEVAFTASGLQLFAGSMMSYTSWAILVHLLQMVFMSPQFQRYVPSGSTQALHVVRLFVDIIARSFGILVGLLLTLVATLFQRVLHPECHDNDTGVPSKMLGLKAPVIEDEKEYQWVSALLLVVASIAAACLGAVHFLRKMKDSVALNSLWISSRLNDNIVNKMAQENPVTLLVGVARVCLLRSRIDLLGLMAFHILQMSATYFAVNAMNNPIFWSEWEPSHSWFHCD